MRESKEKAEASMKQQLNQMNEEQKKHEQELSSRDRRIAEFEMKFKSAENESNELKGDITGSVHHSVRYPVRVHTYIHTL